MDGLIRVSDIAVNLGVSAPDLMTTLKRQDIQILKILGHHYVKTSEFTAFGVNAARHATNSAEKKAKDSKIRRARDRVLLNISHKLRKTNEGLFLKLYTQVYQESNNTPEAPINLSIDGVTYTIGLEHMTTQGASEATTPGGPS